jgi:hypothetical protein
MVERFKNIFSACQTERKTAALCILYTYTHLTPENSLNGNFWKIRIFGDLYRFFSYINFFLLLGGQTVLFQMVFEWFYALAWKESSINWIETFFVSIICFPFFSILSTLIHSHTHTCAVYMNVEIVLHSLSVQAKRGHTQPCVDRLKSICDDKSMSSFVW